MLINLTIRLEILLPLFLLLTTFFVCLELWIFHSKSELIEDLILFEQQTFSYSITIKRFENPGKVVREYEQF